MRNPETSLKESFPAVFFSVSHHYRLLTITFQRQQRISRGFRRAAHKITFLMIIIINLHIIIVVLLVKAYVANYSRTSYWLARYEFHYLRKCPSCCDVVFPFHTCRTYLSCIINAYANNMKETSITHVSCNIFFALLNEVETSNPFCTISSDSLRSYEYGLIQFWLLLWQIETIKITF